MKCVHCGSKNWALKGLGGSVIKCLDCGHLFLSTDPEAHEFLCDRPEEAIEHECPAYFLERCGSHSYWPDEDEYDMFGWECVLDMRKKQKCNTVDINDF